MSDSLRPQKPLFECLFILRSAIGVPASIILLISSLLILNAYENSDPAIWLAVAALILLYVLVFFCMREKRVKVFSDRIVIPVILSFDKVLLIPANELKSVEFLKHQVMLLKFGEKGWVRISPDYVRKDDREELLKVLKSLIKAD